MFYLMWQKKSLQKEGGGSRAPLDHPPPSASPLEREKSAEKRGWRWRIAGGEKKKLRKKEEEGEKGRARRNMTDKKQWRRRMMLTKRRDILQLKWSDIYFSLEKETKLSTIMLINITLSLSLFRSLPSVTRQIIIYLAGKRKLVTKKRSDDHVVGAWTSMIGWWLVTKKRSDDHVAGAWTSMIGWWLVSA